MTNVDTKPAGGKTKDQACFADLEDIIRDLPRLLRVLDMTVERQHDQINMLKHFKDSPPTDKQFNFFTDFGEVFAMISVLMDKAGLLNAQFDAAWDAKGRAS